MRVLVERNDAELVALGQRGHGAQDCLLADVDLRYAADLDAVVTVGRVAVARVHGARFVDDHHESDVGLPITIADVHVDRQRFLQRSALVAAGTVRVGPTEHYEAATQVTREHLQREHPLHAEAARGHVRENHRVIRGKAGQLGWRLLGRDLSHILVLCLECAADVVTRLVAAGDQQDARVALHDRV